MPLYVAGTDNLYESGLDNAIQAFLNRNAVVAGCQVIAHAAPDMGVRVSAGTIQGTGVRVAVAQTDLVIDANPSINARLDLVSINFTTGVPTRTTGNPAPAATIHPPSLPATDILVGYVSVPASAANIQNANITDRRLFLPGIEVPAALSLPPIDVQVFTANGTWTKPAGAKSVRVIAFGAGGAGEGGNTQGAGTNRHGGTGGGGGARVERTFDPSALGATETVTIGAGGIASGDPSAAPDGGNTTFGAHVTAYGGSGAYNLNGGSGGAGSVGKGAAANFAPNNIGGPPGGGSGIGVHATSPEGGGSGAVQGGDGGSAVNGGGGSGSGGVYGVGGKGGDSTVGAGGGGGGGGITSGNVNSGGGAGGGGATGAAFGTGGGGAGGAAGSNNGAAGTSRSGTGKGGSGGGGGGAAIGAVGGNGGAAGVPGAGGAGGGASVTGNAAGAGSNGARGEVIVVTLF